MTPESAVMLLAEPITAVLDDTDRVDRVVRALILTRREGYVECLHWLQQAHDAQTEFMSDAEREAYTLARLLTDANVDVGRVRSLMAEDAERVISLAASTPTPEPSGRADDDGDVLLPRGTDLDALLADDLGVKREWRRARELGLVEGETDGEEFEDFRRVWETYVDGGKDYVATLQRRQHEREARQAQIDSVAGVERRAARERAEEAAHKRRLAKQLEEQAKRLESARSMSDVRF